MKRPMQKLRTAMTFVLAVMMAVPLSSLTALAAIPEGLSVQNPAAVELSDGTVLNKTAKPVEGIVNAWDITLRVEAEQSKKTSDTVLVIDRSGSMQHNNRLAKAKQAANSLIDKLLPAGNTINQVAVISFGADATTNIGFTTNADAAKNAVNSIALGGATHTQDALHKAAELIKGSNAGVQNIILLSDGVPTYSYKIKNPDNYLSTQYIDI